MLVFKDFPIGSLTGVWLQGQDKQFSQYLSM